MNKSLKKPSKLPNLEGFTISIIHYLIIMLSFILGIYTKDWFTLFVITFFGAPWVLNNHGHITIDLVVDRLSNERARVLLRISHTIGALMSGALFLFTCEVLWRTYSDGTTVPDTFMFPEWLIYSFAPTTFLLLMIIFIRWVLFPPEGADASITKDLF